MMGAARLIAAALALGVAQGPTPGARVDVGGHALYISCEGVGTPAFVLDAGTGGWSTHWEAVRRDLVATSRVCVYDRAGYGGSDPGPEPRTAQRASDELFYLLDATGEHGPFFIVGHSFGGWVARIFAADHGDLVAGLALVDSAHEDQWDVLPGARAMLDEAVRANRKQASQAGVGSRERKTYEAIGAESAAAIESAREVAAIRSLGDLPLVVVSAGRSFDWFVERTPATADHLDDLNARWMVLQRRLTALSTRHRHIISEQGVHGLIKTEPALVARAVRELLGMGRR